MLMSYEVYFLQFLFTSTQIVIQVLSQLRRNSGQLHCKNEIKKRSVHKIINLMVCKRLQINEYFYTLVDDQKSSTAHSK